ncbi:MAG: hypothetical protein LBK98_01225 [Peptococcaceae bacterium]|jgi:hypothetical protein|nr:hypothetical protein [Peptococcaceae bacterium]
MLFIIGLVLREKSRLAAAFLLTALLISGAGCGGADALLSPPESAAEKNILRLESGELRPLLYGGEIGGTRYPAQDGKISLPANGFSLDLSFNDAVDLTAAESAIQLKGTEAPYLIQRSDLAGGDHIVNLTVPRIEAGDYQVVISQTLQGLNNLPLAETVTLQLRLAHQTEGLFFLLDSSGLPRPISYEECRAGLSLSDSAKTFVLHFDQEVNQTSVEDSLNAGLREQPANTAFTWLTPQQLRLNLTHLQTGLSYRLNLDQGLDKAGNSILGACLFRTGKASNVGVIQLAAREMSMLYQFSEERFSGMRSQSIGNRILLQTSANLTWSFGLGTRQLFTLPTLRYDLAIPQQYREPIWLGLDQLLGYDALEKTFSRVSLADNTLSPILTVPERALECRLSPNGRLLAVACRSDGDSRQADFLLVDLEKNTLLHKAPLFAETFVTASGSAAVNLTWTGDDTLIYADGDDILRAYLSADGKIMDRTNVIERDARILDYLPESKTLLYRSLSGDGDTLYLMQDDKSRRLSDLPADGGDFYCGLVDEETVLYQREGNIYLYSVPDQAGELIGPGLLLGISAGRDKAYYMANAEDYTRAAGP